MWRFQKIAAAYSFVGELNGFFVKSIPLESDCSIMDPLTNQEVKDVVLRNTYPICEFDTDKNPIIQATNFWAKSP